MLIDMGGLFMFDSTDLVLTKAGRECATTDPERLIQAIRTVGPFMANKHLIEACQGGRGALYGLDRDQPIPFAAFVAILDQIEDDQA